MFLILQGGFEKNLKKVDGRFPLASMGDTICFRPSRMPVFVVPIISATLAPLAVTCTPGFEPELHRRPPISFIPIIIYGYCGPVNYSGINRRNNGVVGRVM